MRIDPARPAVTTFRPLRPNWRGTDARGIAVEEGSLERFSLRPGYGSDTLLIEFLGDHRGSAFPNVAALLARALDAQAVPTTPPVLACDGSFQAWRYAGGEYQLDDDGWFLFILASANNQAVMADLERALLASGKFIKQEVDFAQYRVRPDDSS